MKSGKLLLVLGFICSSIIYPQDTSQSKILQAVGQKYTDLIKKGSSDNDVRLLFGDPAEVHPGRIQIPERPFYHIEFVYKNTGRFTTWVYYKDLIKIVRHETNYKMNGKLVSKDMYDVYSNLKVIYLRKDKVVYPSNLKAYHDLSVKIDSLYITDRKIEPVELKPVLTTKVLVVFDKREMIVKSVIVAFINL